MAKIVCGLPNVVDPGASTDQRNADAIFADCSLDAVMMEAYERSASGSGAIVVDVGDEGLPTFNCLAGKYVRPLWASPGSQTLSALEYVYPTTAKDLRAAGVKLAMSDLAAADIADSAAYWVRIVYTATAELRFTPLPAYDYANLGGTGTDGLTVIAWKPAVAYAHDWGVVPAVYLRNLLFGATDADGRCPFEDIVDIQVEIARLLSQVGRGFRYAADPLLVRERGEIGTATKGMHGTGLDIFGDEGDSAEMRGANGETIRSVSNVLEGKARLLEITGTGLAQAVEYVKVLREWGLEVAGAMKADAATAKGTMSGRALDLLQQMLRLLVKRQRIAYGQRGLLPLVRVILAGCANGVLDISDVVDPDPRARMRLVWPVRDEMTLAPIKPVPEPAADDSGADAA